LAEALGIDRSTVARWESGQHLPLPYLQPKLARLLDLSAGQLRGLFGSEVSTSETSSGRPDRESRSQDVVLPLVVDGQRVLVPLDAAAVAGQGIVPVINQGQAGDVDGRAVASSERALELLVRAQSMLTTNDRHNVEAAKRLLDMAIDIDPQFALARAARGYALWRAYFAGWGSDGTTLRKALADVDAALRRDPDSAAAHTTLIRICWDLGWHERALDAGRSICKSSPESLDARLAYARALHNSGLAELALPLIESVLHVDPTNPTATKLGIWARVMSGGYDDAVRAANEYLRNSPTDANTRFAVALAQLRLSLVEDAIHTTESAIAADPDDVTLRCLHGYLYRHAGDADSAVRVWTEGIRQIDSAQAASGNPRTQSWLANIRACVGQVDRAESAAKRIADAEPGNAYLEYRLAHVYAELGLEQEAIGLLEAAVNHGFRSVQLWRHDEHFAVAALTGSTRYRRALLGAQEHVNQLGQAHLQVVAGEAGALGRTNDSGS